MKPKQPSIFYFLAGLLFILNLLQAYFTDLIYDEAYYWYYAKELAWGYFDHPPIVAFIIKLGNLFFNEELGVRLVSCILSVGTVFILWRTIEHPKKNSFIPHFFILVFSMTLVNAYGFFTLPDTPLIFLLALFLLIYKNFIRDPNLKWSLALGVCMALLMYSKYHAALIIIFVFFSNIKLVKNKYAWISVLTSLICYLPHLMWLYEKNFVTIRYHIYERPNRAYEFGDFTLGFFINLIVLFGLTFPWIYRALIKYKQEDLFDRALLFVTYGFIVFFFLSSFNRRIQTQWLIAICIPLVIIVFRYLLEDKVTRIWILRMGIANVVILLYLRVGLAYAPLFPVHYESHGNEEWVKDLESKIGEMPVVFENSYRRAAMYEFYSGNDSYSLNNMWYRQNQYSIDTSERRVQHRDVLYVSKFLKNGDEFYEDSNGRRIYGVYKKNFESFRKLQCIVKRDQITEDPEEWVFYLYNPYTVDIALEKLKFSVAYLNKYRQFKEKSTIKVRMLDADIDQIKAGDTISFAFKLPAPKVAEPSYFRLSISENNLPYGLNGKNIKLTR